jgi:hypothetical protein
MGAELGRLRRGQKTETGMTEEQLRDFAKKRRRKRKGHHVPKPDSRGYY